MDNHRAAGWCWLNELNENEEYNFLHIDHHGDLHCNGINEAHLFFEGNPNPSLEQYCEKTYIFHNDAFNRNEHWKLFDYSNYIKLLHDFRPQWFSDCYFATAQDEDDRSLNIVNNIAPKNLSNFINELSRISQKAWILNFDLDYFYDDTDPDNIVPINREYLKDILIAINNQRQSFAVTTIALSPECCGGWKNAADIMSIVNQHLGLHFMTETLML